ncbi:hypothetical protein VUR80DRAFT_7602 [Thermomyces stellatus]
MVDYHDGEGLVEDLLSIHTLLSFVQPLADLEGRVQKNLIKATILARVKRLAPSETGLLRRTTSLIWAGKQKGREQVEDTVFDLQNCRAIVVERHEDTTAIFTSAKALASVAARAADYASQ